MVNIRVLRIAMILTAVSLVTGAIARIGLTSPAAGQAAGTEPDAARASIAWSCSHAASSTAEYSSGSACRIAAPKSRIPTQLALAPDARAPPRR